MKLDDFINFFKNFVTFLIWIFSSHLSSDSVLPKYYWKTFFFLYLIPLPSFNFFPFLLERFSFETFNFRRTLTIIGYNFHKIFSLIFLIASLEVKFKKLASLGEKMPSDTRNDCAVMFLLKVRTCQVTHVLRTKGAYAIQCTRDERFV